MSAAINCSTPMLDYICLNSLRKWDIIAMANMNNQPRLLYTIADQNQCNSNLTTEESKFYVATRRNSDMKQRIFKKEKKESSFHFILS